MYQKPELVKMGNLKDLTFNDPQSSFSVAGIDLPLWNQAQASHGDEMVLIGVVGFAGLVGASMGSAAKRLIRRFKR